MSLTVNMSQGRVNHLTDTLVRFLQERFPGLGKGAIITAKLVNQVRAIVRENLSLLVGSTFMTAGFLTLLQSILVTAVNVLGFTAGGVLKGSIAALIQSTFFGGATAGWFSVLQGFGATAVISPPVVIVIGVSLAVVGVGFIGYQFWRSRHHAKQRIDRDDDSDSTQILSKNSSASSSSTNSGRVIKCSRQKNIWDFFQSRKVE